MKNVSKKAKGFTTPAVEISIRAGSEELAAVAFYPAPEGEWDVLVGVTSPTNRASLASVLRYAADALSAAAFAPWGTDWPDGDSDERGQMDEFPF